MGQLKAVDFRAEAGEGETPHVAPRGAHVAPPQAATWPWQGLPEQLILAQEELGYILEIIRSVDSCQHVNVTSVSNLVRAPAELAAESALRVSAKQHECQVPLLVIDSKYSLYQCGVLFFIMVIIDNFIFSVQVPGTPF